MLVIGPPAPCFGFGAEGKAGGVNESQAANGELLQELLDLAEGSGENEELEELPPRPTTTTSAATATATTTAIDATAATAATAANSSPVPDLATPPPFDPFEGIVDWVDFGSP